MRAQRDQLLAQRDDPRIAGRRAGLDDQQRVAGLCPHQLGERASLGIADLADHVARHDEVGGIRLRQRGAGFAAFVADVAQARCCRATRSSASARKASLASSSVKRCSDGKASAAAQVAVPGPAPTSSRLVGAKSGLISTQRVQARGDRGIGRGHPRQRIGQRIGLRADARRSRRRRDRSSRSTRRGRRRRCAKSPAACRRARLSVRRGGRVRSSIRRHAPRRRGIQYAVTVGILANRAAYCDHPPSRMMTSTGGDGESVTPRSDRGSSPRRRGRPRPVARRRARPW